MSAAIALPLPTTEAEDRFIQSLADLDSDRVAAAVRAALSAGRPALAARAVGLLGDDDPSDPDLARARKAARFLLMKGGPVVQIEEQLDLILGRLRTRRMKRARRRQRDKLREKPRDPSNRRPLK